MIGARDARVLLGGRPIVDGVTVTVDRGEVVALIGPNGAGKSTLLAALCGDVPLAGGEVLLDGRPLGSYRPVELARLRAVLPQQNTVTFPFTVRQIVAMGRAPWATTDGVDAALATTEMTAFADRPFRALSGGEQARASLARVLAQDTPVLLLDEPTAALDLRHQELVLRTARQRAARGDAVVVVLHDLGLAAAHADRIVLMAAGRVRADGPPADVLTETLLTEVYRHDIEVMPHPRTGRPLVLPVTVASEDLT
ncbi:MULTISPECIES: heme ABC transporter ATP-binding protein [Catenuloplanes]|uniref:Iron complex transport system ATP-binding protein n=1 Tax=Catenuloplanes niger TaxID=587534 RepID=A0AAE3ZY19_9ACTN|nr:heme ABC transporter ATP-binding protein [Catenuloplanes niger]MDR7326916.1 iron complex transport system ATP-binding protein [Catenuloplanes niger]